MLYVSCAFNGVDRYLPWAVVHTTPLKIGRKSVKLGEAVALN